MEQSATESHTGATGDAHRRQAAHLYGLIVSGAVLATAPVDFSLARVAVLLFGTLVVYWAAETYVHWIAMRSVVQRHLTGAERRAIVRDGWPLVASCAVPIAFLFVEALLDIDTSVALDITLVVNLLLLMGVGWQMSRASGLNGVGLVASVGATGLLGAAMIFLKTFLH